MMENSFKVAIIGGGLCGLALAIALQERNVPFMLYESRSSFTEIGAGLTLNAPALQSLSLIKPALGEAVIQMATRSLPPYEVSTMHIRYGADLRDHKEGDVIFELASPPPGMLFVHRQDVLSLLVEALDPENARLNKKFVSYRQRDDGLVDIYFADGSEETANMLVACDGIHSRVREVMFGKDNPISKPHFNGEGGYRGVIPMEKLEKSLGDEAHQSQLLLGPGGFLLYYPVSGGKNVNCAAWFKNDDWDCEDWVVPGNKEQFESQYKSWGSTARKILDSFDREKLMFWTIHHFVHQPDSFHDSRVILLGDAAHAMAPHQGAGAGQGVEDAIVFAEVLDSMIRKTRGSDNNGNESHMTLAPTAGSIAAALQAVENTRKPRFLEVQRMSTAAGKRWAEFYDQVMEGEELSTWVQSAKDQLAWIFGVDMANDVNIAIARFHELVAMS
ncbi:hypothetical protein PFICI_03983 [Pestalotiopsis fici W106-1]|uniref:FAD-binding domain-containing protein n=1 Tax=Pestalotiopsis fici (strain W106-1 / CGMCC3.15140) TaxID=1229662 RepID=W3XIR1_PESFW|nr:uncharacterized protein PFICI_03983 [Pestalotiopsis fici W106-1]ETS85958.1 hypothetical protein PFICI_03983 [Pestalotiopsis fici W106-1]